MIAQKTPDSQRQTFTFMGAEETTVADLVDQMAGVTRFLKAMFCNVPFVELNGDALIGLTNILHAIDVGLQDIASAAAFRPNAVEPDSEPGESAPVYPRMSPAPDPEAVSRAAGRRR